MGVRMKKPASLATGLLALGTMAWAATQGGPLPGPLPVFPADNWWNVDITAAPLDVNSAAYITYIGGSGRAVHADWGGEYSTGLGYGIPYAVVDGTQPKLAVIIDGAPDESDGVDHTTNTSYPFYPIPAEAITQSFWIEQGPPGNVDPGGDRHLLIVDKDHRYLYELYNVLYDTPSATWHAYSGAFFDLNTNRRRPEGWTSSDAAGLPVLPGLVNYEDVFGAAEIEHAFRVTVQRTNGYVFPASHVAGANSGALPMGARLRLKASTTISGFSPEVQRICRALKKHGLIVADNGTNMYISGTFDHRWENVFNLTNFLGDLQSLKASDFEVVKLGWQPTVTQAAVYSFTATPPILKPGVTDCSLLSWWASLGSSLTLSGTGAVTGPVGSLTVCSPGTYMLTATGPVGTDSKMVTVGIDDGAAALGTPTITSPLPGQSFGGTLSWTAVGGANLYDLRVLDADTGTSLFSGSQGSTSKTLALSKGRYEFDVRACSGSVSAGTCGVFRRVFFIADLPNADLSITKTDGLATVTPSQTITYTIVATNNGPTAVVGATVSDPVPSSLTSPTWTCVAAGGGSCTVGPVSGNINDTAVNLPMGATATYTLSGMVSASPSGLVNTATITPPAGTNDPNMSNNSATDVDSVICNPQTIVVPDGRLTAGTIAPSTTAWFASSLRIGNSYSVELKNATGSNVPPGTLTVYKGDDGCGASTLTPPSTTGIDPGEAPGARRVSFTATGATPLFQMRLDSAPGPTIAFTFSVSDTTMFSPAWSTNGSFNTYYSFQNTTGTALNGTLTLLDTAGATLSTFVLAIPAGQTASTNTSSLSVVRSMTGTARFTHDGPPGAIVAEAAIANFSISPAYVQPVKFQAIREAK
jgi:uncharacterized repeat protein (TIGR01451 family)